MRSQGACDPGEVPLCVELSGCLLRTDLRNELLLALLCKNFFFLLLVPYWLCRGRRYLTRQLALRAQLDPALLPYSTALMEQLRIEHASGRRLLLVSSTDAPQARDIGQYLGIFAQTLVVEGQPGNQRLERLQDALGGRPFDYAGHSRRDLRIWRQARRLFLVNSDMPHRPGPETREPPFRSITDRKPDRLRLWIQATRLHQWIKNLLLFIPLVMAHRLDDPVLLARGSVAFLAFGLCASSVYLLNDLLDLHDDRGNPLKRSRPFASGELPIIHGLLAIPGLLAASALLALLLPSPFAASLALYYTVALLYSPLLKRIALVDVLVLAILYSIRIIAGAAAVSVRPSVWLLIFSAFIFLSLALLKRYSELSLLKTLNLPAPRGRGYVAADLDKLAGLGTFSAYMAVLVSVLYISSETAIGLYSRPAILWLLCPLLLYMLHRLWRLAKQGALHKDPVVFILEDRPGQCLAAMGALLFWLAI